MYSVNYPDTNYNSVLGILLSTKTNSPKTSSLPLADFWRPKRFESPEIKALCQKIGIKFEDLNPQKANYCFEYPTPAYENRESGKTHAYSKPSMTDLMILLNDEKGTRITIEAKYTEYVEDPKYSPLLGIWHEDKQHKKDILKCWIDYINDNGYGSIPEVEELLNNDKWRELPYQFLHRTASACFNCKHPILVYQLFYDNTKESTDKLKDFKKLLSDWAEKLQLKLPFFIIETEVNLNSPAFAENLENPSDLFIYMKNKEQYKFGAITVRDGYDTEKTLYNYVPERV